MKNRGGNIIVSAIILCVLYVLIGQSALGMVRFVVLTKVLVALGMGILALFFLRKCMYWYTAYMLGGEETFNKKVDRPRVYLFSILFPILIFVYYNINHVPSIFWTENPEIYIQAISALYFCILLSLSATIVILLFFALSQKFEKLYLHKFQEAVSTILPQRKINPSRAELIFNGLIRQGFLAYDDLDEQVEKKNDFVDIFVNGNIPENPAFKLKMDNIQSYHFYKKLKSEFGTFKLKDGPRIFENRNGSPSYKSISTSANNALSDPKDYTLIEAVFCKDVG